MCWYTTESSSIFIFGNGAKGVAQLPTNRRTYRNTNNKVASKTKNIYSIMNTDTKLYYVAIQSTIISGNG